MAVTASDQELITLQEASERFGIPIPTLRLWRRLSYLTRYQRGDGRVMVDAAEINARIARRSEIKRQDGDQAEE